MEGHEYVVNHLSNLITYYSPPFIYIHDSSNLRQSASVVQSALQDIKDAQASQSIAPSTAFVDGILCFTPRLLYDTVLNELAGWTPQWEAGCSNWTGPPESAGQRFNDSFDGFIHGLRAIDADKKQSHAQHDGKDPKGKARATGDLEIERSLLLVIQRAERLKDNMPELIVPLTRLSELAQIDVTVIFISDLRWDQIKPPLGASPEPYYIEMKPLNKQAILNRLDALFPAQPPTQTTEVIEPDTYHPDLKPLYSHFLATLYSICSPFTIDPDELAYIAAARWPGFVKPLLDERRRLIAEGLDPPPFTPTEDARIRLTRLFTPTFAAALEALYPRLTSALEWAKTNSQPENILSYPPQLVPPIGAKVPDDAQKNTLSESLSRMAKFILVAAFIASTNPAKSDMRMFGRGPDERKKRRKSRGLRNTGGRSGAAKIPQRLLGPAPFPLDRLMAILGVLLEENDADHRPPAPEYTVPGEYTEMDISRVAVYAQVMELRSMHLLHRTSPADRLELSPTFRCGISYEIALGLAKDVGVMLNDLLWEPL